MIVYSFFCKYAGCKLSSFEVTYQSIKEYKSYGICPSCGYKSEERDYLADLPASSIVKSDDQLKTVGDLAKRNTDKFSNDKKEHIWRENNHYRFSPEQELPGKMIRSRGREEFQPTFTPKPTRKARKKNDK